MSANGAVEVDEQHQEVDVRMSEGGEREGSDAGNGHAPGNGEQQVKIEDEDVERPNSKKRKRGPSPPWQFPTAETSTMKTADGRRVSARFNAATPGTSDNDVTRGRSSSLSAPPAHIGNSGSAPWSRHVSPPWKEFKAEGPTSVLVDGKRKSGRVNRELADPPKRVSPRSAKKLQTRPPSSAGKAPTHGHVMERKIAINQHVKKEQQPSINMPLSAKEAQEARIAELRAQIAAIEPSRSFATPDVPPKRNHKRKPSDDDAIRVRPVSPKLTRPPRLHLSPEVHKPSPKLKLRLSVTRRVIPPPHPNAKPPSPVMPPRPSLWQVIESFELLELQQPYMENERGPPDMAWFQQRAERQAVEEGAMRRRILEEAKPGGKLSQERLSIFQPEVVPCKEPPKQYAHHDHLVAHALHLRHLQLTEKRAHRALAKKVAYEALEKWKAKRGPTEEDLREEADKVFRLIYKQVVMDVKAKWALVQEHVQQQRLQKWEEEQEAKRQERLQEKLKWSEYIVARQRGEESGSDEDLESGEDSEDSESEEENMSESSSEDEKEDEGSGEMGEDELKAYLAQRQQEPPDPGGGDEPEEDDEREGEASLMDMLVDGTNPSNESTTEATNGYPQGASLDETLDNLFAEDQMDVDGDTEFEPKIDASEEESREQTDTERAPARRSRKSSMTPGEEADNDEADLSSDESTNMDSTDYDSDEDTSSTEDGANDVDDDEDAEIGSGDEQSVAKNSLLSLFKDEVKKWAGLPTPTTSAEGDEREGPAEDAEPGAEDPVDEQSRQDSLQERAKIEELDVEPSSAATATSRSSSPEAGQHLVPQPVLLRGTLRSYQHAGLNWLASLYRAGTNGILADEMGLGKTIQTISLLAHLAEEHQVWSSHLVIVPTSVILNWVTEFQKFLPGFRVLGYYGTADERQQKRRGWVNDPHHPEKDKRGYNVVVTSYNVAMQDINAIRNVQWHYLVLDEAHNIRNFNSQRWQVLIRLKTRARLLLTGTPLQNSLTELWSLLTFLTAGDDDPAHGDLEEFLSHWKDPVREIFDRGVQTLSHESQRVVEQLHISLRPFLLRRLKSEVEKDLPKKTEEVVVCKLSKRQRQLYQEYMGLAETKRSLAQGNAVSAGRVLLSLRRVCNHPDLFDPRSIETSWALESSVVVGWDARVAAVQRLLGRADDFVGGVDVLRREALSSSLVKRSKKLDAKPKLTLELRELEKQCQDDGDADAGTIAGCRALRRLRLRKEKLEHLRSYIAVSDRALQAAPVYGADLREVVTLKRGICYQATVRDMRGRVVGKALHAWPTLGRFPMQFGNDHVSDWAVVPSTRLQRDVASIETYAEKLQETIVRYAFVTPKVTAPVLDHSINPRTQAVLRATDLYLTTSDPFHESRTRTSIAFPDSRLLIYDSGKLQRLTHLLRDLQSQNSRSLIFTQMTGTLNILEQFLSLLNLPYLRLDGSTPVERRALYAAEFNRPDSKYQCMILSSRAGGIGLNLTGASSVIFYDLDWNPQMDRQCMDRAHRIGQVRDVRVFKMVSEGTVEENILRRAMQKSLLDQAVIQDGHFTTEWRKEKDDEAGEGDGEVEMAIERFLGGDNEKDNAKALESVEDREDVVAAQTARKEELRDDVDFVEKSSKGTSRAQTVDPGRVVAEGHVDGYMVRQMEMLLEGVPFVPPQGLGRKDARGRDRSHRPKRKR